MTRYFFSAMLLFAALIYLPGCGGGGGETKFEPSDGPTAAEEQAAAEYTKQMEEAAKADLNRKGSN